jgi:hypothetical protein
MVAVSNHFLGLLQGEFLVELFGTSHKIFRWYEAFVLFVHILKDSLHVLGGVGFIGSLGHKLDKLLEADLTSVICIEERHGHVDKCSSWFVAALPDVLSQIKGSQHAVVIIVQEVKHLLVYLNISDAAFCH